MKHFLLFSLLITQFLVAQGQTKVAFNLASDKATVAIGDTFTVSVNTKNFIRIASIQFGVKWSKTDYIFLQDNRQALPINVGGSNYGSNYDNTGTWLLSWFSPNGANTTLTDTTLVKIKLKALKAGAVSNICFNPDLVFTEVVQNNTSGQTLAITEADFTGLNCGFLFTQTSSGVKTITVKPSAVSDLATIESQVYPNPFKNDFTIAFKTPIVGDVEVALFDALGKKVFVKKEQARQLISIHVADLPTGLYNYRIRTNQGVSVGKVLKE